ncbi:LysR family transcriptional regulator [Litorilituus sediminis]|uniref:LysR family transcriptional regulator n=1 Tax=Litorilituus sediminis TaxID=718192 RepID=A0A4P6P358_9GAMM|nr:LysR family transcriptional regulator [Litorilituus sediminis]QBG35723.1 LysR family transcriptional regulator [Litorilituus sediminis]
MLNKIKQLDDLLLFVTLVQAGSFTQAAIKLNMAKSKLSRRLRELEQALGCDLLHRTTRKQELTQSGRLLYAACQTHIDALTQVEEQFLQGTNSVTGRISLLLPLEFFNTVVSSLLAEFLLRYPEIDIHCQHYSGAVPAFDPQFDLCFVLHEQTLPHSNWIGKELLSFPQSVYFASKACQTFAQQLPIEATASLIPEQLLDYQCILSDESSPWLFRQQGSAQAVYVKGRANLASPEMRLQACKQGLGIAKLPDYVVSQDSEAHCLKRLDVAPAPVAQRLTVLYQSRNIALRTRTFLDFFQSNVAKFL